MQLLMVKLTYNLPTPENGGITTEVLIPNAVPRLCYGVKKIEVVVGWVSVYGKTTPLPRRRKVVLQPVGFFVLPFP